VDVASNFLEDIGREAFLSRQGTAESAQAFLVLDVDLSGWPWAAAVLKQEYVCAFANISSERLRT
jgi:hypothetical protein